MTASEPSQEQVDSEPSGTECYIVNLVRNRLLLNPIKSRSLVNHQEQSASESGEEQTATESTQEHTNKFKNRLFVNLVNW